MIDQPNDEKMISSKAVTKYHQYKFNLANALYYVIGRRGNEINK